MSWHEYGESAVLLEHPEPLRLWLALRDEPGLDDVVPAATTLLLIGPRSREVAERAAHLDELPPLLDNDDVVEIDVHYDGEDLESVATECGFSVEAVIELHASADYRVGFNGFSPGFPYLLGLPEQLRLPRRETPRTKVPAGSVAIADEWCGIYPTESPGGWHLLGHTDAVLFDAQRIPPVLLPPGTRVRLTAC